MGLNEFEVDRSSLEDLKVIVEKTRLGRVKLER